MFHLRYPLLLGGTFGVKLIKCKEHCFVALKVSFKAVLVKSINHLTHLCIQERNMPIVSSTGITVPALSLVCTRLSVSRDDLGTALSAVTWSLLGVLVWGLLRHYFIVLFSSDINRMGKFSVINARVFVTPHTACAALLWAWRARLSGVLCIHFLIT